MKKYYCDRCGKEVGSLYEIRIRYPPETYKISFNGGEFCEKCYILIREQIDALIKNSKIRRGEN